MYLFNEVANEIHTFLAPLVFPENTITLSHLSLIKCMLRNNYFFYSNILVLPHSISAMNIMLAALEVDQVSTRIVWSKIIKIIMRTPYLLTWINLTVAFRCYQRDGCERNWLPNQPSEMESVKALRSSTACSWSELRMGQEQPKFSNHPFLPKTLMNGKPSYFFCHQEPFIEHQDFFSLLPHFFKCGAFCGSSEKEEEENPCLLLLVFVDK